MKTVTISLAIAAAAITWAGAKAKSKPCMNVTYYYMDMREDARTILDFTVNAKTFEKNTTRSQCLAYRDQIHKGPPKQQNRRSLLDATCAPCGPLTPPFKQAIQRNLKYWEATMQASMAEQWAANMRRRAGLLEGNGYNRH